MSMDKKGMSELISFVLLVGFAVAMATTITMWSIDQVKKVDFDKNSVSELCNDVEFEVVDVCFTTDATSFKLNLTNTGLFDISYATIGRSTPLIPESWCLDLNLNLTTISTTPLEVTYKINGTFLNGSFDENFNQYTLCEDLQGNPVINQTINSISIIPWIKVEDQSIPCTTKKIIIDKNIGPCI